MNKSDIESALEVVAKQIQKREDKLSGNYEKDFALIKLKQKQDLLYEKLEEIFLNQERKDNANFTF